MPELPSANEEFAFEDEGDGPIDPELTSDPELRDDDAPDLVSAPSAAAAGWRGFYEALEQVLKTKQLTVELDTMVLQRVCQPFARRLSARQVRLAVGGRTAVKDKPGDDDDVGVTSSQDELAVILKHKILYLQVSEALNIPWLQSVYSHASITANPELRVERDCAVYGTLWHRVRNAWRELKTEDIGRPKLLKTMRGKVENAANHCREIIELAKDSDKSGDGVLHLIGSNVKPLPSLDIRALAEELGWTCQGKGVLISASSQKDHLPGLPSPKQMAERLKDLLAGKHGRPPLLQAISVFQFVDLCLLAYGIPTPGKVELSGGAEDEDEENTPPDGIPAPLESQTQPIIREVGMEPLVGSTANRIIGGVRKMDQADLPPAPIGHNDPQWAWQQTLAQGVLWADRDLTDGSTGHYNVATFVRVTGRKQSEAYEQWAAILQFVATKLCHPGLAQSERQVIRCLWRRFHAWKPEIVADVPLDIAEELS